MILFKRAGDLSSWLQEQRTKGKTIGFVPTMGALHTGHISLIDISKTVTGCTVCSIFVNPTQFNDPKDFQKYPITIEKDIYLLEKEGTDALFLPDVEEVYPGGTANLEKYELGRLETLLEGKYRPGHFQGVCQIMRRLLDIVAPDDLFMGQKDYQQCMVVQRLLELMKSAMRLHPCPIVREVDGLAMSSRNMRLTEAQRAQAPAIYRVLSMMREERGGHTDEAILSRARAILAEEGFRIDYVEIADAVTLEPIGVDVTGGGSRNVGGNEAQRGAGRGHNAVALIAAFLGEIRLIDNMLLP